MQLPAEEIPKIAPDVNLNQPLPLPPPLTPQQQHPNQRQSIIDVRKTARPQSMLMRPATAAALVAPQPS